MGLYQCIVVGMLVSMLVAIPVWAWLGPFAGMLLTGAVFGIGALAALAWEGQGRT